MKVKKLMSLLLGAAMLLNCNPCQFAFADSEEPDESVSDEPEIPVWDGTADTSWYDDEETEFHLYTAEEFAGLQKLVASGKTMEGITFYLENDVNIGGRDWEPIELFQGYFNGNHHSIIFDLGIRYDTRYADEWGVFKNVGENGVLCNIKTSGVINCGPNRRWVGLFVIAPLCAYNNGIISNCINEATIIVKADYSTIGFTSSSYQEFKNNDRAIGGICGINKGEIRNCMNNGEIQYTFDFYYNKQYLYPCIGGICGTAISGTILNSFSCNEFNRISCGSYVRDYVGGIAGYGSGITIQNCYSQSSGIRYGGIIGSCYGFENELENVYFGGEENSPYLYAGIAYVDNTVFKTEVVCEISVENCYYISSSATKGINTHTEEAISIIGETVSKNKANMQSPAFAETLGDAFVYVEGDYPKLAWEIVSGDVNQDYAFTIADIVMLQKYLLTKGEVTNPAMADADNNGVLNAVDLTLLKQQLLADT